MLLYWGMFTIGFMAGAILSFVTFAAKKPEEDIEYETNSTTKLTQGLSGDIRTDQQISRGLFLAHTQKQLSSNPQKRQ